jgi:hypothetical protein
VHFKKTTHKWMFPKNSNWTALFIGLEVNVTNPHNKQPNGILRAKDYSRKSVKNIQ